MKFPITLGVLALCVCSAAALLCAQKSTPGDESSAVTATTELVLVPAQVKGPDGKPLRNLKQDDFVLRSDGKPQPIRVFDESQTDATSTASVAATMPTPAKAQTFTNVPDAGMPKDILIIAFDLVNTAFLDQGRTRQQLLKYLTSEVPNQHFALVAITKDGLAQIHNFSSDPAELVQALQRVQSNFGKNEKESIPLASITATAQFVTPCSHTDEYNSMVSAFRETQIYGAFAQKIAVRGTLTALKQIAQAYAGVPGRKSVIWLTGGMPTLLYDALAGGIKGNSLLNGDPELLDDYYRAFEALNNANVAIYGVDVKGIKLGKSTHNPVYDTYENSRMVSANSYNDDAIKVLSSATGGKSCTANAELKDCIDQAVEDSTSYYMLGFYVPQQERNAGWHKLDVKLVSGRGSVRSRSSYYLAPTTPPSEKQINRSLRDVAAARIGYTGVAFAVQRQTTPGKPPMMRILVPATSVLFSPGHPQLSYDIVTVPLTNQGELATDLRVIHLNLTAEQTQTALTKGWAYFDPVQGTSSQAVKYIIRDNGTGQIGSLVIPPEASSGG